MIPIALSKLSIIFTPLDFFFSQIVCQKLTLVIDESSCFDTLPNLGHHLQVEMDIVNAGKNGREHLIGVEKVVDVCPAEVGAGVTVAARIDGEEVAPVVLVGEADLCRGG